MFSLVVTILSLALIVAFMLMTLNFSGMSLDLTRTEARSAGAVNEILQIKQAITQYAAQHNGVGPASINALVPTYLKQIPDGWGGTLPGLTAFEVQQVVASSEEEKLTICKQVNIRMGLPETPPACSSVTSEFSGCCIN